MTTERPFGVVPLDQADGVDVLRSEIPLLERWIYMNTGTSGPSPRAVTEAQIDWIRRLERDGGGSPATSEPLNQLVRDARHAWARILGAPDVGNIALTHNTSEGLAIVAAGLPWQPGDEVIVSELEHLSGLLPWAYLQRKHGIVVRNVKASGGNLTPEDVEAVMTDRTRLLCFSHVAWNTGAIVPVAELVELARRRGVLTLIDGAQSVGHVPLDMAALGCDFYAVPGQKWLLGPEGTGALYVKRERLEELTPPLLGWASAAQWTIDFGDREGELLHPDARRFEVATPPYVALAGVTAAIGVMETLGMEAAAGRIAQLAAECRRQLAALPGVHVVGSDDPERFSGLVCFTIEGQEPQDIVNDLFHNHGIVSRTIPDPACTRLSLHAFNTEEEIERVVDAVRARL